MIKKLRQHGRSVFKVVLFFVLCVIAYGAHLMPARAQQSLSVTVTPPLFQLTISPGESWQSTLKIVNNNAYDVTYYAQLVDMQPNGEDGRSKFIPLINETVDASLQTYALAHWIHISSDPIVVKAGASQDLPFTVAIPANAEPGGHYAAILVGTQPDGLHGTGNELKVSSFVSSLLFVRINGNVTESGRIREFITTQQLYQSPKADFLLRFENTGNTHVRPQGDITIYNMWGKERGQVLINQDADSSFGNVLPQSIRRFEFSWAGDSDPFDIGLYSAVVTLSYGQDGKQNVTGTTYFWVVPIIPVVVGLAMLVLFLLSLVWFIRRYIRRALALEQKRQGLSPASLPAAPSSIIEALIEPVKEGVIDLRNITSTKNKTPVATVSSTAAIPKNQPTASIGQFVRKYKLLLVFLVVLVVGCVGMWLYFNKVLVGKKGFQITDVHIQAEAAPSAVPSVAP